MHGLLFCGFFCHLVLFRFHIGYNIYQFLVCDECLWAVVRVVTEFGAIERQRASSQNNECNKNLEEIKFSVSLVFKLGTICGYCFSLEGGIHFGWDEG